LFLIAAAPPKPAAALDPNRWERQAGWGAEVNVNVNVSACYTHTGWYFFFPALFNTPTTHHWNF